VFNRGMVNGAGFRFFAPQNARFCAISPEKMRFKKSLNIDGVPGLTINMVSSASPPKKLGSNIKSLRKRSRR
jgi:hypothetical protein